MKTGEELWRWYKSAVDSLADWKKEAKELFDLRAGHQWTEEELDYLKDNLRSAITFNRTDPLIDSAVGHQIFNRQQIQYLPREPGDVSVNEVLTGAVKWVDDESDADTHISDAFGDMLICGLGWTETRIDYDEHPEGKIIGAERVNPLDMVWDPMAEQRNLSDARYFMRGKWFTREIAEEMWPDIAGLDLQGTDVAQVETHPHITTSRDQYSESDHSFYRRKEDEVYVIQCQYHQLATTYMVQAPTGQPVELPQDKYNKVRDEVLVLGKRHKRRWYQVFFLGEHILEEGPAPSEDRPSLIPMTGKRDVIKNQWYGICRGVKDPQRWANKFFSDAMDIVSKNRRGGAFVESDAFQDPRQAQEKWNDPAGLIMVNSGALGAGKIVERQPAVYPVGMDRLMEFAIRAIPDVTGINQELMGLVARNQPGILEQQRKQAGLTILAGFFDSLRQYQKLRGRLLADFVRNYISDGRLVRILGQDGNEQFIPLTRDKMVTEYDVVVDQAPMSSNTREQVFMVMRELLPVFQMLGVMPIDIMDYLPLPKSLVDKMKQQKAQTMPQQMQLEQAAAQIKLQQEQAEAEHKAAMAEKARMDTAMKPYEVSISAAKA